MEPEVGSVQRTVILLILLLVWVAVLIPHHLAHRAVSRPADSISAFRTQLSILGRTAPATATSRPRRGGPGSAQALLRRRRRRLFCSLLGTAVATLVLGFLPGLGALHAVHLVCDLLLAADVAWLIRLRMAAETRTATVSELRPPRAPADSAHPVFRLQRTGT